MNSEYIQSFLLFKEGICDVYYQRGESEQSLTKVDRLAIKILAAIAVIPYTFLYFLPEVNGSNDSGFFENLAVKSVIWIRDTISAIAGFTFDRSNGGLPDIYIHNDSSYCDQRDGQYHNNGSGSFSRRLPSSLVEIQH